MPKILFTGKGTSGSWQCRGVQLGGAIGDVKPRATDFRGYDLVVLVKRPAPGQMEALRKVPWVWDVVDFYPQPLCTKWTKEEACAWVRKQIDTYKPRGVIWPNLRMAEDCGREERDCVLYHHHRPGLNVRPPRRDIKVVGYEGSPRYLGRWRKHIEAECKRRGLTFREGRADQFDVCVAFRDKPTNGYAQRHWKSNVKLANCHGAGVPFIGGKECGYLETAAGGELWCERFEDFGGCLDALTLDARAEIHAKFLLNAYALQDAAKDCRAFLESVAKSEVRGSKQSHPAPQAAEAY